MPYKELPAPGDTPDCRPVACPSPLRRIIEKAAMDDGIDDLRTELAPVQLAVGVKGGCEVMAHAARLALELHPDWVAVKLDVHNAHNEFSRDCALKSIAKRPRIRRLLPALHATKVVAARLHIGNGDFLERRSEEGGPQGAPPSSAEFALTIHDDATRLDSAVAAGGGAARFISDDGMVWGPPELVWPAVARFTADLGALGLTVVPRKGLCYSPSGLYPGRDPAYRTHTLADHAGIHIANIPIGQPGYIAAYLASKADSICSKIETISDVLCADGNEAWCALYYSSSRQLDYWARGCFPEQLAEAAALVDAAVATAAQRATGVAFADDPVLLARLRLPGRLKGGGLRSVAALSPAAFVGACNDTLPRLPPSNGAGGLCSHLEGAFGAGAFDDERNEPRYATFLASGLPTARALAAAWAAMRNAAGDVDESARLSRDAAAASGTQRQLTSEVELGRAAQLAALMDGLPADDRRRIAYHANGACKAARVWLSDVPDGDIIGAPSLEFREIAAAFFGAPSPACAPLVGAPFFGRKDGAQLGVVDAHGDNLASAAMVGDGWRKAHDSVVAAIVDASHDAGLAASLEVFGIFSPLILAGAARAPLDEGGGIGSRRRQGLVPDLKLDLPPDLGTADGASVTRPQLGEIKFIHHCPSRYRASDTAPGKFGEAVKRRADLLQGEYEAHARELDETFGGHAAGQRGPCLARLLSFGLLIGIVFGAFHEASPDFERWISSASSLAAHARGMRGILGVRTVDAARGRIAFQLRRHVAWAACRGNARLIIDRLEFAGPGGADAARRRAAHAQSRHARRARRYSCLRGPNWNRAGEGHSASSPPVSPGIRRG